MGGFRQRIAVVLVAAMFFFSALFVLLWVFAPEFSANGGTIAGIVLGQLTVALVGIIGKDVVEKAIENREEE